MTVSNTFWRGSIFRSALSQCIYYSGSILNLIFYLFHDNPLLARTILVTSFVYAISELGLGWLVPRNEAYVLRSANLRSLQTLCYIFIILLLGFFYEFDISYVLLHVLVISVPSWAVYNLDNFRLLLGMCVFRMLQYILFFFPSLLCFNVLNSIGVLLLLFSFRNSMPSRRDLDIVLQNLYLIFPKILPMVVMTGFGFVLTIVKKEVVEEYVYVERYKSLLSTVLVPITYFIFLSYNSWNRALLIVYVSIGAILMLLASLVLNLHIGIFVASLMSFLSSVLIHFYFLVRNDFSAISRAVLSQVFIVIMLSVIYTTTALIPTMYFLALSEIGLFVTLLLIVFWHKYEYCKL